MIGTVTVVPHAQEGVVTGPTLRHSLQEEPQDQQQMVMVGEQEMTFQVLDALTQMLMAIQVQPRTVTQDLRQSLAALVMASGGMANTYLDQQILASSVNFSVSLMTLQNSRPVSTFRTTTTFP